MLLQALGSIILFAGLILYLVSAIGLLIAEFRESIVWGIFALFFQVVHLLFIILYFDRAKKWLGYLITSIVLTVLGVLMIAAGN